MTIEQTVSRLPLRATVTLDEESDRAFQRFVNPNGVEQVMAGFRVRNWLCYSGLGLGFYVALRAEELWAACMIITVAFFMVKQHLVLARNARQLWTTITPPVEVSFEFTEAGVSEVERGVESRFAWETITRWYRTSDALYLQLRNGKWALLPERHLLPDESVLGNVIDVLTSKGVPGVRVASNGKQDAH